MINHHVVNGILILVFLGITMGSGWFLARRGHLNEAWIMMWLFGLFILAIALAEIGTGLNVGLP